MGDSYKRQKGVEWVREWLMGEYGRLEVGRNEEPGYPGNEPSGS